VVLNRKNSLFLGSARGGRAAASLAGRTSTCRRHDVDPQNYLSQLLVNLPVLRISDLPDWLPDRWKATQKIRLAALQSKAPLPRPYLWFTYRLPKHKSVAVPEQDLQPVSPVARDSLRTKILQPVARRVGIRKQIGWHTFRRTYSSLLADTGNDVKVVQELMLHSKLSPTMEVYAQAGMSKKRAAQRKAVDGLFNRASEAARDGEDRGKSDCSLIAPSETLLLQDFAR